MPPPAPLRPHPKKADCAPPEKPAATRCPSPKKPPCWGVTFACRLGVIIGCLLTAKDVHIILDNYAAHKHEAVKEWLAKRDRWHFHFTPTSCSWLNAVEGFFGKLACRRLRRGVYDSIEQLEKAILDFIDLHNGKEAKPFNWTASPERIIAARQRGFQMINSCH